MADRSRRRPSSPVVLTLALFLAVMTLGWIRVDDEKFWLDETLTALVVRRPWDGLLSVLWDQESGMFGYYVVLWGWARLFAGDAALRMFSVLGGALCVVTTFWVARRCFDQRVALVSSLLLIVNPFFLRYLDEARAYSWIMAIGAFVALATDRLVERRRRRDAIIVGALIGVGTATQILFALVAIALLVSVMSEPRLRPPISLVLIAATAAIVTFLPVLPAMLQRTAALDWLTDQSLEVQARQLIGLLGGRWLAPLLVVGLLVALLSARRADTANPWVGICVGVSVLAPLFAFFITAIKPIFLSRYLAGVLPYLVVVAAFGLVTGFDRLRNRFPPFERPVQIAAVCGVMALVALAHPWEDRSRGPGAGDAVDYVLTQLDPGEFVVLAHYASEITHHLGYRPDIDPGAAPITDVDRLAIPRRPLSSYADLLRSADRFYILYWDGLPTDIELAEILENRTVTPTARFGTTIVFTVS